MAANKVPGVRAALCGDLYTARMSREHNDANVLVLGGRLMGADMAADILQRVARDGLRGRPPRAPGGEDRRHRAAPSGGTAVSRLEQVDPEIAKAIRAETERQSRNLELIASENFVSEAVLEAVGSVMTNKYAEGYPGKRYYGGCEIVDIAENLAISRAKELFGAEHVNVQPHSGSQANMAVYFALLKPGDTVLGPNLAHGGHLTAGSPMNFSGRLYNIVPYGVTKETERIDMDQVRDLARAAPAEAHHRGRLRVSARHRVQAVPRDRRRGRRPAHGRHRASGGSGRGGAAPLAGAVRRLRHHHHPQDPARSPGRHGDVPRLSTRRTSTAPCCPASRAGR